jgi:hypothetical protein
VKQKRTNPRKRKKKRTEDKQDLKHGPSRLTRKRSVDWRNDQKLHPNRLSKNFAGFIVESSMRHWSISLGNFMANC